MGTPFPVVQTAMERDHTKESQANTDKSYSSENHMHGTVRWQGGSSPELGHTEWEYLRHWGLNPSQAPGRHQNRQSRTNCLICTCGTVRIAWTGWFGTPGPWRGDWGVTIFLLTNKVELQGLDMGPQGRQDPPTLNHTSLLLVTAYLLEQDWCWLNRQLLLQTCTAALPGLILGKFLLYRYILPSFSPSYLFCPLVWLLWLLVCLSRHI